MQVGTDGFPPLKGTHMKYDVTGGINEAILLSSFYGRELFYFIVGNCETLS